MRITHRAAILIAISALVGCHKPAPAPPSADAGEAAPDAIAFQIVAQLRQNDEPSFRRAYGGPAFMTVEAGFPTVLFELDPAGALQPWTRIASDFLGRVGVLGVQPDGITGIEGETWHDSAAQQATAWEVAGSSVRRVSEEERRVGYYPWKDGSVLVLRSSAVMGGVTSFPTISMHTAKLEALVPAGKTAPDVPSIPENIAHADRFMAYPDGRVFLLAEPKVRGMEIDPSNCAVYELGASTPPIPAPGFNAADQLLPGDPILLAKYDRPADARATIAAVDLHARTVTKLAIDTPMPLRSVSRGDDGAIWFVTGVYEPGVGYQYGRLYRGRIDGAKLAVTPVDLPNNLTPLTVLAHGAGDVWVAARETDKDPYYGKYYVLHSQTKPAPTPAAEIDRQKIEAEAWAERPPDPWREGCDHPLLVLGPGDEIAAAEIVAAAKKNDDNLNPPIFRRGQLGGNDIWGAPLVDYDTTSPYAPPKVVKHWVTTFPKAKLYCAGMLTKTELPMVRNH